jgi:hypothetical protein
MRHGSATFGRSSFFPPMRLSISLSLAVVVAVAMMGLRRLVVEVLAVF